MRVARRSRARGGEALQAVVLFIAFGLLVALAWVRLSAPDIALAEAAIGAGITGALLLDAAGHMRGRAEPYPASPDRRADGGGDTDVASVTPKSPRAVRIAALLSAPGSEPFSHAPCSRSPETEAGLAPLIEANLAASGVKNIRHRGPPQLPWLRHDARDRGARARDHRRALGQRSRPSGTWAPVAEPRPTRCSRRSRASSHPVMLLVSRLSALGRRACSGRRVPGGLGARCRRSAARAFRLCAPGVGDPVRLRAVISVGFIVFLASRSA
jgi:hypothetical protein